MDAQNSRGARGERMEAQYSRGGRGEPMDVQSRLAFSPKPRRCPTPEAWRRAPYPAGNRQRQALREALRPAENRPSQVWREAPHPAEDRRCPTGPPCGMDVQGMGNHQSSLFLASGQDGQDVDLPAPHRRSCLAEPAAPVAPVPSPPGTPPISAAYGANAPSGATCPPHPTPAAPRPASSFTSTADGADSSLAQPPLRDLRPPLRIWRDAARQSQRLISAAEAVHRRRCAAERRQARRAFRHWEALRRQAWRRCVLAAGDCARRVALARTLRAWRELCSGQQSERDAHMMAADVLRRWWLAVRVRALLKEGPYV